MKTCSGEVAQTLCEEYLQLWRKDAESHMLQKLREGKHAWLAQLVPTWDSPRPLEVIGGGGGGATGRALLRWCLSEHDLEVETGRYRRMDRNSRWCKRCLCSGRQIIGDEWHALTSCTRANAARAAFLSTAAFVSLTRRGLPLPGGARIFLQKFLLPIRNINGGG